MSTVVKGKNGKKVVLLNPSEKRNKAFDELQNGIKLTNDSFIKTDAKGKPQKLTAVERAYRAGYVQAGTDSAKCFKSKHPRYKRKTF